MAKSKKKKPSVKVRDLRPSKNPKGGVQKIRESASGVKIVMNK